MNRGYGEDGQIMNLPNPVLGTPTADEGIFTRPPMETLSPIYTPQVSFVGIPQYTSQLYPPALPMVTRAPSSNIGSQLTMIMSIALAIVLIMWVARIMFYK